MFGLGQTGQSRRVQCTSDLPPRADLARLAGQVREEPEATLRPVCVTSALPTNAGIDQRARNIRFDAGVITLSM